MKKRNKKMNHLLPRILSNLKLSKKDKRNGQRKRKDLKLARKSLTVIEQYHPRSLEKLFLNQEKWRERKRIDKKKYKKRIRTIRRERRRRKERKMMVMMNQSKVNQARKRKRKRKGKKMVRRKRRSARRLTVIVRRKRSIHQAERQVKKVSPT